MWELCLHTHTHIHTHGFLLVDTNLSGQHTTGVDLHYLLYTVQFK